MAWGVSTQKGTCVYLHILKPQQEDLLIPKIGVVCSASLWPNKLAVDIQEEESSYRISIPASAYDPIDTIITLELNE